MAYGRTVLALAAAFGLAAVAAANAGTTRVTDDQLVELLSSGVAIDEVARLAGCPDSSSLDAYLAGDRAPEKFVVVQAPFVGQEYGMRQALETPLTEERDGLVATPFRFSSAFTNSPFQASSASTFEAGSSRFSVRPLGPRFGRLDDPFDRPGYWSIDRR